VNSRLDQIVNKYSDHFKGWIDRFNRHADFWNSDRNYDDKEQFLITMDAVNVLSHIAGMFYEYGNFKDEFENDNFYQHIYGPELIINSKKTKSNYRLGINEKGIYLNTHLIHVENLKNMDDQFWSDILKLADNEYFELVDFEFTNSDVKHKYPELCYNYKGVIFKIFRQYFFNVTESGGNMDNFGDFKITWPPESGFEDTIRKGCEIFKLK
jgi:hypothetical protein